MVSEREWRAADRVHLRSDGQEKWKAKRTSLERLNATRKRQTVLEINPALRSKCTHTASHRDGRHLKVADHRSTRSARTRTNSTVSNKRKTDTLQHTMKLNGVTRYSRGRM